MSKINLTPEQQVMYDSLTNLQRLTVIGVVSGKSQRQAYYDAGGKAESDEAADSVTSRMLSDGKVKTFYDSLMLSKLNDAVMSREEALERLSLLARNGISELVDFGTYEIGESEDGQPIVQATWKFKDSVLCDPKKLSVISELAATKDGIKIKTHSQIQAIQQLAKMQGWESAQKVDVSSSVDITLDEASKATLDALAGKLVE